MLDTAANVGVADTVSERSRLLGYFRGSRLICERREPRRLFGIHDASSEIMCATQSRRLSTDGVLIADVRSSHSRWKRPSLRP